MTEATATHTLQKWFYYGVGRKYLGFQIADEELQADGSLKKIGTDGWRHWTVPLERVKRQRWRPIYEHLKGLHRGIVSIGSRYVPCITVDLDRHTASINPDDHVRRVMKAGSLLRQHFSRLCWIAEVNPRNGSAKFFGFGHGPISIAVAEKFAAEIHDFLVLNACGAFNHRGAPEIEVFPHNCVQVGLPMRTDKVTVVSSGVLTTCIRRRRLEKHEPFVKFETYSVLSFLQELQQRRSFDEATLIRELKKGCANLPFLPAALGEAVVRPTKSRKCSHRTQNVSNSEHTTPEEPNSYKRQQDALLELCRGRGRVVSAAEGLEFIRDSGLYSGDWADNENRREDRVAYLLRRCAATFDPTKCRRADDAFDVEQVHIGKFDHWANHFVGRVRAVTAHVNELGEVIQSRGVSLDSKWVSVFLSIVEFCCVTAPNEDCSLPQSRAEYIWTRLCEEKRISVKWDDRKWKATRDWLERRRIVHIVDRNWWFGHGKGKAMRWALSEDFDRLHVWWKTVRKSSGNEPVRLNMFLKNMMGAAPLNSYPHRSASTQGQDRDESSQLASRGPPDGDQ
jgi:hypothetical protein